METNLRSGAIAPLFRKYAIPGVIGLLFIGLQTIIDGVVIGNYVGANALASVSLIMPCYSLMTAVAIIIGIGCQTLISIRLGEKNQQEANDALRSGVTFLALFAVCFSLLIYLFAENIARLLGANDVLVQGSTDYIRALVPFFPVVVMMFFSDYIIKATGRPIFSMAVMSTTVVINILLDLLFVAVWDMGITGAGIATGIAFTVGALINVPQIFLKRNVVSLRDGKYRNSLVWQMFYNGSSEGVSELSAGISTLMFNIALMHYIGESGVAAFTAINYVFFIGITIFLGVSDGIIPIIGYNYGARQPDRIKQTLRLAVKCNFLIGLFLFAVLSLFGKEVISLFFRSEEADVLKMAAYGTSIYAFAFLVNGLNILSASYFTALGNAKVSIIISLMRGFIFVMIGILVLPKVIGIDGIWLAIPIAELITITISFLLVRKSLKDIAKIA